MIWFMLDICVLVAIVAVVWQIILATGRQRIRRGRAGPTALWKEALQAESEHDFGEAIRLYGEIVRLHPSTTWAEDAAASIELLRKEGKGSGVSTPENAAPDSTMGADGEEEDEPPPIRDPAIVCTVDNLAEADTCCALLDHFGIDAQFVQIEGTNPFLPNAADAIVIQVPSGDTQRARQLIDRYRSVKDRQREADSQEEQIAVACEECGGEITFSADRRGGIEVCPHCGKYVDVPE